MVGDSLELLSQTSSNPILILMTTMVLVEMFSQTNNDTKEIMFLQQSNVCILDVERYRAFTIQATRTIFKKSLSEKVTFVS